MWEFIQNNWGGILVLLAGAVQFSPIKVDLLALIGKHLNARIDEENKQRDKETKELISSMDKKIEDVSLKVDMHEIDRLRTVILDFANDLQHGQKKTKDNFMQVMELNEKYHSILKAREMTNGVLDIEYEFIKDSYRECFNDGSFLVCKKEIK